jgi:hypothetical protein
MGYLIAKALLSGIIVAVVSEVAKRNPSLGGLIVSLPLVSILAVIWLWRDTGDPERVAAHLVATAWYVLPTLPMFIVMPMMLRAGIAFWTSLAVSCVMTGALYLATVVMASKAGIDL